MVGKLSEMICCYVPGQGCAFVICKNNNNKNCFIFRYTTQFFLFITKLVIKVPNTSCLAPACTTSTKTALSLGITLTIEWHVITYTLHVHVSCEIDSTICTSHAHKKELRLRLWYISVQSTWYMKRLLQSKKITSFMLAVKLAVQFVK